MQRRSSGSIRAACVLAILLLGSMAAGAKPATSPGCGRTLASGTYSMRDQGVERTYRVLVPSRYDARHPLPLVLVFHGWGGDEDEFLGDARIAALSDERGYVVVAPRGLGSGETGHPRNAWTFPGSATGVIEGADGPRAICDVSRTHDYRYPSCAGTARNTCSWTQCEADDVAFARALVTAVEARLCIDPARVYATGGSNGGMLAWALGQDARTAPLLRAIAPIIGLPHAGDVEGPGRKGPLPVLLVTGTADPTVPPGDWEDPRDTTTHDGDAYYYTSATAITRRWSEANGCPVEGHVLHPVDVRGAPAECRTYCAGDGWPAVLDCRAGMRHDYGFPWSWRLVLDFFDAHR